MPKFIYLAGQEPANGLQTTDGKPLELTKLPAETVAFGIEFLRGQSVEVRPDMFRDAAQYQHAVNKLRVHAHFKEDTTEEATVVEVKPDKKRKPVAPVEPETPPE